MNIDKAYSFAEDIISRCRKNNPPFRVSPDAESHLFNIVMVKCLDVENQQETEMTCNLYIGIVVLNPLRGPEHVNELPRIIVPLTAVLASDENAARTQLVVNLPDEYRKSEYATRLEVRVRPF